MVTRSGADKREGSTGRWERPVRFRLLLAGILVVTAPAVTLATVYAVLLATRSAVARQLTPLEIAEIYLVELAAFALFSYLLYRLAIYTVRQEVAALDEEDPPA